MEVLGWNKVYTMQQHFLAIHYFFSLQSGKIKRAVPIEISEYLLEKPKQNLDSKTWMHKVSWFVKSLNHFLIAMKVLLWKPK